MTEDLFLFIQEDPLALRERRTSFFSYVANEPLARWDPSGLVDLNKITDLKYDEIRAVWPEWDNRKAWAAYIENRTARQWMDEYQSPEGIFTVGIHGFPGGLSYNYLLVTPEDLAREILNHPNWKAGMTVRLMSCFVGSGQYAMRLAELLNTLVEASPYKLHLHANQRFSAETPAGERSPEQAEIFRTFRRTPRPGGLK